MPKSTHGCVSVKRDAHNSNVIAYASDKKITLADTRQKGAAQEIGGDHHVLDIDFNPIKMHTLLSSSEDSTLRFWDTRKLSCLLSYSSILEQTQS